MTVCVLLNGESRSSYSFHIKRARRGAVLSMSRSTAGSPS